MRARVKATGEIVDVVKDGPFYNVIDGYERYYEHELDFNDTIDYWTRLEHQYAGMAMQGILSNNELYREICKSRNLEITIMEYAHALVQKQKEKEERK